MSSDQVNIDKSGTITSGMTPTSIALRSMVPTGLSLSSSSTGGSLSDGTYSYRVSATTMVGQSLATAAGTIVLSGGTSTQIVIVSWARVMGSTGYKVYGRSSAVSEQLIATITSSETVSWTDTGSVTPSGALPTSDTSSVLYITSGSSGITQCGYLARAGGLSAGLLVGGGCAFGHESNAETYGTAMGRFSNGSNHGVAMAPISVDGSNYGVALGYNSTATDHAVGIGSASSTYGVGIGGASTNYSVSLGYGCVGGSAYGVAIGYAADASGNGPTVALGQYSVASRYGEFCRFTAMPYQSGIQRYWSILDWYGTTTNAISTELFLNGTASSRAVLPNNSSWFFTIRATSRDNSAGVFKGWTVRGAISRWSNAASTEITSLTSTSYTPGGGTTGDWALGITADTTNGSLRIDVTGASGVTVKWNISCSLHEIRS